MKTHFTFLSVLTFLCMAQILSVFTQAAEMPLRPTLESCSEFNKLVTEDNKSIYRESSLCMSGPARIGSAMECNTLTGQMVKATRAWPECSKWEFKKCGLVKKREQVRLCFNQIKNNDSNTEEIKNTIKNINIAQEYINENISSFQSIIGAWNNPKIFIAETIAEKINRNFLPELSNGDEFSERGKALTQETYDFIFNKSAGNENLYSSNPVIAAIQGGAAKELYKMHSDVLNQLELLVNDMESVKDTSQTLCSTTDCAFEQAAASLRNGSYKNNSVDTAESNRIKNLLKESASDNEYGEYLKKGGSQNNAELLAAISLAQDLLNQSAANRNRGGTYSGGNCDVPAMGDCPMPTGDACRGARLVLACAQQARNYAMSVGCHGAVIEIDRYISISLMPAISNNCSVANINHLVPAPARNPSAPRTQPTHNNDGCKQGGGMGINC